MNIASVALIVLGVVNILGRKSILGVLIGFILVLYGVSLLFVLKGPQGDNGESESAAVLVFLLGAVQITIGISLALRRFYQTEKTSVEDLSSLRN